LSARKSGTGLSRRDFLKSTALTAVLPVIGDPVPRLFAGQGIRGELIDTNVNIGSWPMRDLPCSDARDLLGKLRARGVTQAWTGSFEGLLHKNLASANNRLAEACRKYGHSVLLPFGSVNPKLPAWEEDLHSCANLHGMFGIRLHPNYHGYRLDDPSFLRVLELAAEHRLIVQMALLMEDERMMHPRLRVTQVDPAPIVDALRRVPRVRLVLLNALGIVRGEALRKLMEAGYVSVEISTLEGVGGVGALLEQVPLDRLLYGSHAPLFYPEAAELKLKESSLTPQQDASIRSVNAKRLLG
jgi:uncharacterized protein